MSVALGKRVGRGSGFFKIRINNIITYTAELQIILNGEID
jgi:hypothetical protein